MPNFRAPKAVTRWPARPSLWLLIVSFTIPPLNAQYSFDLWTADDGLPQNIISGVRQTPDGYLWLATYDGLVRFDGVRFTVFNKSNSPGITSNRFESLDLDRSGDLWLPTENLGVTRYHGGSFTTYTTRQGLPNNVVRGTAADGAGRLWALSGNSIMLWQQATGQFVDVTPKELKVRYKPFLWQSQDGFWGADQEGLHCFIKGQLTTYRLPAWLPGLKVNAVALEQSGTIWLETIDGHRASIRNGVIEHENSLASGSQPETNYRDHRGNVWTIHVGNGLIRFINNPSAGKAKEIGFSLLYEDREGNLWLGTDGEGLYRVCTQAIKTYSKEQGLPAQNVYPIYQDRAGAIWLGIRPMARRCPPSLIRPTASSWGSVNAGVCSGSSSSPQSVCEMASFCFAARPVDSTESLSGSSSNLPGGRRCLWTSRTTPSVTTRSIIAPNSICLGVINRLHNFAWTSYLFTAWNSPYRTNLEAYTPIVSTQSLLRISRWSRFRRRRSVRRMDKAHRHPATIMRNYLRRCV